MAGLEISDEIWEAVKKALPPEPHKSRGGRPPVDDRKCFEGILWLLGKELPWRKLPIRYGSRWAVNRRFQLWISSGAWPRMLDLFLNQLSDKDEFLFWLGVQERLRLPKGKVKRRYATR